MPRSYLLPLLALILSTAACSDGSSDDTGGGEPVWMATPNPSVKGDAARSLAIGADGTLLVAGSSHIGPVEVVRVEKRTLEEGDLVAAFGQAGVLTIGPGPFSMRVQQVVSKDDAFYIVIIEELGGFDERWRIEKRSLTDGSPVTSFGVGGVILSDPTNDADPPERLVTDGQALYIGGMDLGGFLWQWRLEKREPTDGSLIPGFGQNGVVTAEFGLGNDSIQELAVADGFLYIAGTDTELGPPQWHIEKRRTSDGTLHPFFGRRGIITSSPSMFGDAVEALALDDDALYVGGFDQTLGVDHHQWRIEKRLRTNGQLVAGFGNGGVLQINPGPGRSILRAIAIEGTSMYLAGWVEHSGDLRWRVEKRRTATGELVAGFGSGGVIESDVTSGNDYLGSLLVHGTGLYLAGLDDSGGDARWRIERRRR